MANFRVIRDLLANRSVGGHARGIAKFRSLARNHPDHLGFVRKIPFSCKFIEVNGKFPPSLRAPFLPRRAPQKFRQFIHDVHIFENRVAGVFHFQIVLNLTRPRLEIVPARVSGFFEFDVGFRNLNLPTNLVRLSIQSLPVRDCRSRRLVANFEIWIRNRF